MSTTRAKLLARIKELKQQCDKETMQCFDIEKTKEYQIMEKSIESINKTIVELQEEITETRELQAKMKSKVPNSLPLLTNEKLNLMKLMNIEGVEGYEDDGISIHGKFSEKRGVDAMQLLKVLNGDLEEFTRLVKPTQKALKDYVIEHEADKGMLLSCIKVESRELTDVDIVLL